MTSLDHDDSIEIISCHADSTPMTEVDGGFTDIESIILHREDFTFQVLPSRPPPRTRKKNVKTVPKEDPKQKRIKGAVMVIASLLIIMSLVLVGVTLSMSDHIDEMVRKIHHSSTTVKTFNKPPPTTPIVTTIPSPEDGDTS